MRLIPSHIQIETIYGYCNASCIMCNKADWKLNKAIMSCGTFEVIIRKFEPFIHEIEYVSLFWFGEPLLDQTIDTKIQIAKNYGLKGIGIATNGVKLDSSMAYRLLKAGLDTLIVSIDGYTAAVHEGIRVGTSLDTIVTNVEIFLQVRNSMDKPCKVLIRFIRQESNRDEWQLFSDYWNEKINPDKGDAVLVYDAHNWGNDTGEIPHSYICRQPFEKMFIHANGEVGLCCIDANLFHDIGNVVTTDPIDLFNSDILNKYRDEMTKGNILSLSPCKTCHVPLSDITKTKI